jgi:Mg-chelatase subunit ChlI
MSLRENLTLQRQQFLAKTPQDVIEVISRAAEQLRKSGIADRCLTTGDTAPNVTIQSSDGPRFMLYDTLQRGPLVLSFFRGNW